MQLYKVRGICSRCQKHISFLISGCEKEEAVVMLGYAHYESSVVGRPFIPQHAFDLEGMISFEKEEQRSRSEAAAPVRQDGKKKPLSVVR